MYYFIWTPILHSVLIGSFYGKRRGLVRVILLARSLWLNFKVLKPPHMLCFTFDVMGVDDLVLFLKIEGLKVVRGSNSFYSIVPSMFSLIDRIDTLGIMVSHMLIYHLSSPRSTHEMLIILNKVY
jgi:hypothetical protein